MRKLCVYCGSRSGHNKIYMQAADELAIAMVEREIDLVYGGATIGLMGKIADSVLKKGGKVTGIIPHNLFKKEVDHKNLSELIYVNSMHERKAKMAELSDGFIALPGGYGTIEEVMEAITWRQLKISSRPIGLLNIENYYDGLIQFLNYSCDQGFVSEKHKHIYTHHQKSDVLLDQMLSTI